MKNYLYLITIIIFLLTSQSLFAKAKCSDMNSIAASNKVSEKLLSGKVFKTGVVLKLNLPSHTKEVASYIYVKSDGLYYSVFTLVNTKCKARVTKRTTGKH